MEAGQRPKGLTGTVLSRLARSLAAEPGVAQTRPLGEGQIPDQQLPWRVAEPGLKGESPIELSGSQSFFYP